MMTLSSIAVRYLLPMEIWKTQPSPSSTTSSWDGRVVESEGAEPFLPEYEDGARYVIVLEPTTDIAAVYNSFLAFEIDHSEG